MNRRLPFARLAGLALVALAAAGAARAESAEEKGLAIAREADRRDTGWGDSRAELQMILRNREGQSAQRKMRMSLLEVTGDGDKSLVVFDWPKDIDGTAVLTHSHKKGDDDQWLFLPALKRVKRISGANKSGSFVGSEFAYEDLSSQEVEKYRHVYLRDEPCGPLKCFVVERFPVDPDSGYTRQIVWLDQAEYRVHKIEYYDRKKSKLKTLTFTDYRKYLDKFWRAHKLAMVNHQTGKSTELIWSQYSFRNGLEDRDFSQSALRRAR